LDIYQHLDQFHNKESKDAIIQWILNKPSEIETLIELFFSEEKRIKQRSAWSLGDIGLIRPDLINPYADRLISQLDLPNLHPAVIRNTLRLLEVIDIPEPLEGIVYEKCFNYLMDVKQTIAVRVFSMSVLAKLANKFPELKEELIAVIQEHIPYGSAGFKARSRMVLAKLR